MERSIKNRLLLIMMLCLAVPVLMFAGCGGAKDDSDDTAYAYCSTEYNASFGNYGSFSICAMDGYELERDFSDLSKFTLGGAFAGMKIEKMAYYSETDRIVVDLTGTLASGDGGTISGSGIVKNKSTSINVRITPASASSNNKIFDNVEEQKITIELVNACFNKDIKASDFALSGACKNMTVASVSTDSTVDDEGGTVLSQTAVLTLKGNPTGSDYAYIDISQSATTFNKSFRVVLETDLYGAVIRNDHIDTDTLSDIVYVDAVNVSFSDTISASNITFDGALKDYATLKEVKFVNKKLIALYLTFPYTFVSSVVTEQVDNKDVESLKSGVGYITFDKDSVVEKHAFTCSTNIASPEIESTVVVNGNVITMQLNLLHEQWGFVTEYNSSLTSCATGEAITLTHISVNVVEEKCSVEITLPKDSKGLMVFTIKDAYDIVDSNGKDVEVDVKIYVYVA